MDKTIPVRARLDLSQWLFVLTGIIAVVIPWWLGMAWLFGAMS